MKNIVGEQICALFDFDGTITKKSTIFPFFLATCGWRGIARAVYKLAWPTLMYFIKRKTFTEMMHLATDVLLSGRKKEELEAAAMVVLKQLTHGTWEQAQACFLHHIKSGHRVAIVTGGYGFVAKAWLDAHQYNADVFSSEIIYGPLGVVSARMICVEREKLVAIEWGKGLSNQLYAYGNSQGDREMLESSDFPFWVDKRGAVAPFNKYSI